MYTQAVDCYVLQKMQPWQYVREMPWQSVYYMQIEEETDVYWKRESRESHDQIRERGRKFIQWLMARPEQRLAVVSHSSFMYFLLSNYGHDASETVQSEIRRW